MLTRNFFCQIKREAELIIIVINQLQIKQTELGINTTSVLANIDIKPVALVIINLETERDYLFSFELLNLELADIMELIKAELND